ncbi:MAG TPA: cytochrome c peroxidase [Kofleriaceae bacterium]
MHPACLAVNMARYQPNRQGVLEWVRAMWGRVSIGQGVAACLLVPGCWSTEPPIDGVFTPEEWTFLQTFKLPEPALCPDELCPPGVADCRCDAAAMLGKHLFFEAEISGPITEDFHGVPGAPGAPSEAGKVSCSTCHDAAKFFSDTRPGQVSMGTAYTRRNALGLLNIGYKRMVAVDNCPPESADSLCTNVYSWNGQFRTAGEVLELALGKAMHSDPARLACAVVKNHLAEYVAVFSGPPCDVAQADGSCTETRSGECHSREQVFDNVVHAFDAYERRLDRADSPFDRYLAGDASGLDAEAKRGLALFIGKAMCVDCHRPPLLSDLRFHNTGVAQRGPHVPGDDHGLADYVHSLGPEDAPLVPGDVGRFLTPPLRNVSETAPYMHAGQLASLSDVIEFYRRGGGEPGHVGAKDPRLQALDLDHDEALALEAFLRSLTGIGALPANLTDPAVE